MDESSTSPEWINLRVPRFRITSYCSYCLENEDLEGCPDEIAFIFAASANDAREEWEKSVSEFPQIKFESIREAEDGEK